LTRRVKSCGAVLFKARGGGGGEGGRPEYLLLRHRKRREWGFPKGHAKPGESEEQAARREIAEECGIKTVRPAKGFRRAIGYRPIEGGETVAKSAVYFLGEVSRPRLKLERVFDAAAWVRFEEGIQMLPFEDLRMVLRAAHARARREIRRRRSTTTA